MSVPTHAERLFRRIQHALQIGRTTTSPNDSGNVQTVQIKTSNAATRDAVPVVYHYGFSAMLPIGSDTVTLSVSGDSSNGVIVATAHQASRPKNLKAGQVLIYTEGGDQILLGNGSGMTLTPGGGQVVTVEGSMAVTGDLKVGNIDVLQHVHPLPAGGTTGAPEG